MDDKFFRIWNDAVLTHSRYYPNFLLESEENHEDLSNEIKYPGRGSNRAPPKHESRPLPLF
jgi:hypothetical protein